MKLHLPKMLLTAVLAAVAMAPAAWGVSDTTDNSGWDKILDGSNTVAEDSYGVGDATITSVDTADSKSGNTTLFIRSNAGVSNATIGTLTISEGDTAKIDGWYDSDENHPEFALLTISTLNFGNNSSLSVLEDNTVQVNAYSGTFKGEVTGTLKLNLGSGKSVSFDKESNVLTGDGTIEVMSGTLKMRNQSSGTSSVAGTIKVAGGATLSLDTGDALGYNANATDAVILKGTSAESMATMQMTGSDVTTNGRQTLTTAITMQGHARITGGSLETLGNIGNNGGGANTLTVTGTNNEISSVVYLRSNLIVNVTGESDSLEISGNIDKGATEGDGSFTKSGAGTLTLSGTNTISTFNTTGGQTDFGDATTMTKLTTTGGSSIIKGSAKVTETLAMQGGGNIDFTAGTHSIKKLDIHNLDSELTETLTIAGATVTITGGDQTQFEANKNFNTTSGAAAVVVGHWHSGTRNIGAGKIVVGGETASASVLDVSGATIRMSWDSSSNLNIKQNGTVYAKGLQFANEADDAVITLEGGRLNIGGGGLTANTTRNLGSGKKREFNLNSGTLGALADTVNITAGTPSVNGAVSFDTDIVDATGTKTGSAAVMNFSELVTVTSTGVLTTKGSGRVAFNNGLSLSGSMTIESGSSVSLAGNSILNKAITNNGMLELGGVIDISSLEGTTTSTFDDPDKNGFETISANYEVVTGTGVSNVTTTESLQWKIGTNLMQGTLNSGTLSIADSKGTTYYVSKGNINRAALITNTAASGVKEDTLFALNGGVLQLSAGETMNGSQVIVTDEGGTSTISLADTSILTNGSSLLSKVTGSGTVEIATTGGTSGYSSTFAANSGFTGTTHVKSGNFTINSITFGNKLELDNGVNIQLNSGTTYEFAAGKELILNGTTEVHQNSNPNKSHLTFKGNVSGDGTYFRKDGGTLTFDGTVNLGEFKNEITENVNKFNGNSTIGTLTAKAGQFDYGSGTHKVTTLDMSVGGSATSTVTLKKNETAGKEVVLTASTLWLHSAATLNIEEGATLKLGTNGIVNIKGTAGSTASAVSSSNTGTGAKYLISGTDQNGGDSAAFTISNAEVTIASGSDQTIGNALNNSSLINDGGTAQTSTGKVIANNQANSFVDVKAITGSIELMNLVNGGVQNLEVAAGKSVVATDTNSAKATVSVSGQATFGAGATLSANLTLASNAELVSVGDENGISLNGGTLTLGGKIGLGQELKGKLDRLTGDATLVLFTNVSDLQLTLNDAAVEAALLSARNSGTTSVTTADASAVFAGIAADQYTINFAQDQVFLSAMPVPEPTTSMLGLVGLVALTFRRRRK